MDPVVALRRSPASRPAAKAPIRAATDVDALLQKYAPLGRQQRTGARRRQLARAALVPLVALAAVGLYEGARGWLGDAGEVAVARRLAELDALKGEINAERREWQRERVAFREQSAQLMQRLADIEVQRRALDEQRGAFELRQTELDAAIARLEQQRQDLDRNRGVAGRTSERQAADLERQKQQLARQREQFRSQSGLVARELEQLDAQRRDLETQHEALEVQRRELQVLMERFEEASGATPAAPSLAPQTRRAPADGNGADDLPLMASNAVADDVLGDMRGGLDVGEDMQIAFGLTRSGSVNGVEQFSSTFRIDDLATLASGAGLNPAQLALLQQGVGNVLDPGALVSLTGNFGTVIQNTLDNQSIATMTVIDVSLQNVSGILSGISASDAIGQSLSQHQ
jgi:hypothetical protein